MVEGLAKFPVGENAGREAEPSIRHGGGEEGLGKNGLKWGRAEFGMGGGFGQDLRTMG